VLEGHGRADAAKSCGMDRQTLRDWVIRYNEHSIAGLSDLPKRGGAAPKLSVEEKAVLTEWVQQGPDLAEDGVVRWRLCDLRERIQNVCSWQIVHNDIIQLVQATFSLHCCCFN
jgi:transposase